MEWLGILLLCGLRSLFWSWLFSDECQRAHEEQIEEAIRDEYAKREREQAKHAEEEMKAWHRRRGASNF